MSFLIETKKNIHGGGGNGGTGADGTAGTTGTSYEISLINLI